MTDYKKLLLKLFKKKPSSGSATSVYDLLGDKKIILYGGGDGFITFSVFVLNTARLKVHILLDRKFKDGDTYFGIPAISPLKYRPTQRDKEEAIVIITVGKRQYHQEILACLQNLRFKNVMLATDIYEYHLPCPPPELEKKGFDYYLENKKKIMACFDILSDDLSRKIFSRFIQTHIQKKPVQIPSPPLEEQYFPRDINLSKGYSRFVNCGAYDGDTLRQLNLLHGWKIFNPW